MSQPSVVTLVCVLMVALAAVTLLAALVAPDWHRVYYKDTREDVSLWGHCTIRQDYKDCRRITGWKIICANCAVLGLVWLVFTESLVLFYGFMLPDKVTAWYVCLSASITGLYIFCGVVSWGGMSTVHDFPMDPAFPVTLQFSWGFYLAVVSCLVTWTGVALIVLEYRKCPRFEFPLRNIRHPQRTFSQRQRTQEQISDTQAEEI